MLQLCWCGNTCRGRMFYNKLQSSIYFFASPGLLMRQQGWRELKWEGISFLCRDTFSRKFSSLQSEYLFQTTCCFLQWFCFLPPTSTMRSSFWSSNSVAFLEEKPLKVLCKSGDAVSAPPQDFLPLTLSVLSSQQLMCSYKFITPEIQPLGKHISAATLRLPSIQDLPCNFSSQWVQRSNCFSVFQSFLILKTGVAI